MEKNCKTCKWNSLYHKNINHCSEIRPAKRGGYCHAHKYWQPIEEQEIKSERPCMLCGVDKIKDKTTEIRTIVKINENKNMVSLCNNCIDDFKKPLKTDNECELREEQKIKYECPGCGNTDKLKVFCESCHREDVEKHYNQFIGRPKTILSDVIIDNSLITGGWQEQEEAIRPTHYNKDEEKDVIAFCGFHNLNLYQFNIIKYVFRYDKKDGKKDLIKALNYIRRLMKEKINLKLTFDIEDI